MDDWLSTTFSVVAGGLLTAVSTWLNERRITDREREQRKEERHDRISARRSEFQRETLLALQLACQRLIRNAGASLHHDIVAYRTSGKWQKQLLPDELSNQQLELTTETMLLATRIRDEEVRQLVHEFRIRLGNVFITGGEAESQMALLAAGELQGPLLERIGKLIREIDEMP
jgi:hypothetical protein